VFFGRQREFIHGSTLVSAVSNAVKAAIVEETYLDPSKIVVIHNGINANTFVGHIRHRNNPINIMYSGRIIRAKGVFDLVDMVANLPKVILNFYGDGEDINSLKQYAAHKKLESRVKFFGKLEYKEVVSKFFENDIFVLPTKRVEGFPMTIVEAMFAGMPVVAFDVGGIRDAVINGETGFLIEAGNKKLFAERLGELADNFSLREKMGGKGRTKAQQEFSVDVMLNKYEDLFKKVTKRGA
jgi:glycosyltransferase involved in cell wall biosynthesis